LNLLLACATNGGPLLAPQGLRMPARSLSGWQIVTLMVASIAVIAMAAVALILGKDAVVAIAVILVLAIVFVTWFLDLF
jgi:hypothetical protein